MNGEVEFYAHCITKLGLKMGYWEYVGNIANVGKTDHVLFRNTNDYGSKPGEQIKISNNWHVWKINDNDFTWVGKLKGENRKAESTGCKQENMISFILILSDVLS